MDFVDLKKQYMLHKEKIDQHMQRVLDHGQYIMGPEIWELESRLADYVDVSHAITVSSGTDALLIAMMALGIGAGDEVITTPFSFIATAEAIILLGARPVFIDIEPRTLNMDPTLIEKAITAKTKAIMPVSLYGQCSDFGPINTVAKRYGVAVIEDGCQSFGATYKDRRSCGLTTIGCTSFFPSKPLGCYGDGGACFTNDDELAKSMREIRVHGQDRRYHHPRIGINGRLDTLQAAVLLSKLDLFPWELEARQEVARRYDSLLEGLVVTPFIESFNTSAYAQYTVQLENRDVVQQALKAAGIPTAVHYPIPLNQQPALRLDKTFLHSEHAARHVLSLPIHPYLSKNDQDHVVETLKEISVARRTGIGA